MQHRFFALISRMRYISRWGLMRNTFEENVQEHSHMVAVLAHALAMIQRDILKEPADPERCATAALFHDASEILTGDLPTPIKYYNPDIRKAYKAVEAVSAQKLLSPRSSSRDTSRCSPSRIRGSSVSSRRRTSSRPISSAWRSSRPATASLSRRQSRPWRPWWPWSCRAWTGF